MKSEFLTVRLDRMDFDEEENETEEEYENELGNPPETIDLTEAIPLKSLPEKSRGRYEMTYATFIKWQESKKIKFCSEKVLLTYFEELAKKYKPSTLWSHYSMLRAMMHIRQSLNIAEYSKLNVFLKKQSVGFQSTKSLAFTADELKKFFEEAPDEQYLASKVIAIFGVYGSTRNEELVNMRRSYVTHADGVIIVRMPGSKVHEQKTFIIEGHLTKLVKQYEDLRPENATTERYFLNYQYGKCTNQVIGIHKFAKIPKQIATYLGLKNADHYKSHSFKKISTTTFTEKGANMSSLKKHGLWKSKKGVAEGNSKIKRLRQDAVPSVNLDLEITDGTSQAKKVKTEDCSETITQENTEACEAPVENMFEAVYLIAETESEIIRPNDEGASITYEDVKIFDEPSEKTLRRAIMELKEPILIRNILRKFNAENSWTLLDWNLQTLAEKFGNARLPFRKGYNAQTLRPQWEVESSVQSFTMKEFIKKNDSEFWYYFDYKHMHEWCKNSPEIIKSVNWNRFGFDLGGKDSTIWIGNKGAHTNCHQDSYGCNLVAQIHGKKEWILFPPEAAESLKPVRVPYEESTVYSSINFFSPSEEEEELLKNIPGAKSVILEPGDVLLVPKSWWHYVESLNLSVSVNVWLPLETDSKARLKEALVKLIINGIGGDIPTSQNSKSSVAESINFIKMSLEEIKNQRGSSISSENNTAPLSATFLRKAYPFNIFLLENLDSEKLQTLFSEKRNRFATGFDNSSPSVIKLEEVDPSKQALMENIVNAFCSIDVIDKVADRLLNKSSQ